MPTIRWAYAFLDNAPGELDASNAFWQAATSSTLSPVRGPEGQFATLVPERGEAWVKVQRLDGLPPGGRVHVDLAVDGGPAGLDAAVRAATDRGAVVEIAMDDVVVMRSPGGFPFCLTSWEAYGSPAGQVREGSRLLDQVCLDIPRTHLEQETAFWQEITGWELREAGEEFRSLLRPAELPLRLLLQRLDDEEGPVRGHLDLASEDRDTEVAIVAAKAPIDAASAAHIVDIVRSLRAANGSGVRPTIRAAIAIGRITSAAGAVVRLDNDTFRWACRDILSRDLTRITRDGHTIIPRIIDETVTEVLGARRGR